MTREEKVALAIKGSEQAAARVRAMKDAAVEKPPRTATGHMPFRHRTVGEIWLAQEIARRRHREARGLHDAIEYGFDPESLKVSAK